jgi:cell division protein FtsW
MEISIYRMRHRDILSACVLGLLFLGVVMVQSASTSLSGCIVRAASPDVTAARVGPIAPAQFIAATASDGIELAWDPDPSTNVLSYKVYRAEAQAGPFELLESIRKPESHFKDTAARVGSPSFYRVCAVDDDGREGTPSSLACTRPGAWRWTQLGSRHLMYVAVALLTFFVVGHFDYAKLAALDKPVLRSPMLWSIAIAALACLAVLAPGVGTSVNGARRWIKLGPIQVQPSELAKWAVVLFLAYWLTRRPLDLGRFVRGFLPTLIPIVAICLLVVMQDFGTAALIGVCALTMLLAGRVKAWHLFIVLFPAMAGAGWFIAHKEYRLRRIMAFRDPYASPQGEGYHMIQSLLSFSTGGLFGRGLGNGIQKLGYLPEDTTDFIFAVICEELGLFGAMLTVALYLGILFVAWQVIRQKRDDLGRMLAFGIGSMLGLQAAINIAVATVSVPTKGLSLPLVSAGGSGLVITCAALGLLYSVTRFEREVDEPAIAAAAPITRESAGFIAWLGRKFSLER